MISNYELLAERVRHNRLKDKIMTPQEAASMVKDGYTLGVSGMARAGYPKTFPLALAERGRGGEKLKVNIYSGASVGEELDGELSSLGMINRRLPYQSVKSIRNHINNRTIRFVDQHLSQTAEQVRYGYLGKVDLAVIEALGITEDGGIIPTTSVTNSPTYAREAEAVIVEINTVQPEELEGVHDVYIPGDPPFRREIPIYRAQDRVGLPYIEVPPEKIKGIIGSDIPDNPYSIEIPDQVSLAIADQLCAFLNREVNAGRLPATLLPVQGGIGTIGNAILEGLADFKGVEIYSEVLQDNVFKLMEEGIIAAASGCAITLSPEGQKRYLPRIGLFKDRLVLRPQEISNHPEIIRRLGVIAINTAVELDIYGQVNSTHTMGSKMLNGIGGSGDFARNGSLSIFATPATMKGGNISSIVPMVTHVDNTEHDVMVIVTEEGIADLRGLSGEERAESIIENCASPLYRPLLLDYLREAARISGGNRPHLLDKAYSWHLRLQDTGTMLP